jgi:hypothetical protein
LLITGGEIGDVGDPEAPTPIVHDSINFIATGEISKFQMID